MKYEILTPPMGESITEATVGALLKKEGDVVKQDAELLELETDKLNQVIFASHPGKLSFLVKTGDKVSPGTILASIEDVVVEKSIKIEPPIKEVVKAPLIDKPVMEKPVETNLAPKEIEKRETRKKLSRMRQVIAERLVGAQHEAAMLTTFNEVDMSQVMLLRDRYKELFQKEYQVKLGFMSFFIKAAISALEAFPEVNAYLDKDEIVFRNYFDISVAISTERGLVVPVIRDADKLTFYELEQKIDKFGARAKTGDLKLDELQGGSFTITNGGVFGSLLSTPILNPPQVAILGMHKIEKRPVVINDQVVIRPMMYLALTYDHRVLDGREAVSFLVHIKQCLEDPARILLDI